MESYSSFQLNAIIYTKNKQNSELFCLFSVYVYKKKNVCVCDERSLFFSYIYDDPDGVQLDACEPGNRVGWLYSMLQYGTNTCCLLLAKIVKHILHVLQPVEV